MSIGPDFLMDWPWDVREGIEDESELPRWLSGKESAFECRRHKRCRLDPWVGKIPPEEEMATHSRVLAWRIPWTEEPGGLQSMGLQRVGHDWLSEHTHVCPFHLLISTSSYKHTEGLQGTALGQALLLSVIPPTKFFTSISPWPTCPCPSTEPTLCARVQAKPQDLVQKSSRELSNMLWGTSS